jgi:hypothetical protein
MIFRNLTLESWVTKHRHGDLCDRIRTAQAANKVARDFEFECKLRWAIYKAIMGLGL